MNANRCDAFTTNFIFCDGCIKYKEKFDYAFMQNNLYYLIYTIILITITFNNIMNYNIVETRIPMYFALFIFIMWYSNDLFLYIMTFLSGYSYDEVKRLFYYEFKG